MNLARTIAGGLFSTLLTLMAFEIGTRLVGGDAVDHTIGLDWDASGNSPLHIRSPDSTLVYELRPNASVTVAAFHQTFTTNSLGFRDQEYAKDKPRGTYRILALGDSITFGWAQAASATWPKQLEQAFAAAGGFDGRPVEVINMGIGGYNSVQEAELLTTKGVSLHPDLVIVGYCLNDDEIGSDNGLWDHFSESPSALYNLVHNRTARIKQKYGADIVGGAFAQMAQAARQAHFAVVVAIFPELTWSSDGAYSKTTAHARVAELARMNGFTTIDLLDSFKRASLASVQTGGDIIHPNDEGHRVAAREIFEALSRLKPESDRAGDD